MVKKIIFLICLLWPTVLFATPSITSLSITGNNFVVTGTGLGDSTSVYEIWKNFEEGVSGDDLDEHDADWLDRPSRPNGCRYRDVSGFHSDLGAYNWVEDVATHGSEDWGGGFNASWLTISGVNNVKVYVHYMHRWTVGDDYAGNTNGAQKQARIASNQGSDPVDPYDIGDVGIMLSDGRYYYKNGAPNYNVSTPEALSEDYYYIPYVQPPNASFNYMGYDDSNNVWRMYEHYGKLSTPGAEDGYTACWISGHKIKSKTGMTLTSAYDGVDVQFVRFLLPLMKDQATCDYDLDADNIAINADGFGHVFIGDASTFAACTASGNLWIMNITAAESDGTGLTCVNAIEDLTASGTFYLYVFDEDGVYNESGYEFIFTDSEPTISTTNVSDTTLDNGQTGVVITGANFEAAQGTGTVSIGGVAQTVTAWADTEITFTAVQGALNPSQNYSLVVTNDSSESSSGYTVQFNASGSPAATGTLTISNCTISNITL